MSPVARLSPEAIRRMEERWDRAKPGETNLLGSPLDPRPPRAGCGPVLGVLPGRHDWGLREERSEIVGDFYQSTYRFRCRRCGQEDVTARAEFA